MEAFIATRPAAVPDWIREPERETVREHAVTDDTGRTFSLHVRGRELLEVTETTGGTEKLVRRGELSWTVWEAEVKMGAFESEAF